MKKYIIYGNIQVGYIENICTCEKCRERGMAEVFINDLNDNYLDCIKANEIENIIYLGDSLAEAINELINHYDKEVQKQKKINHYLQMLVNLYSNIKIKDVFD